MQLTLKLLETPFTIHRLSKQSDIPSQVFSAPIYFISKTDDELSIVIPQDIQIESEREENDWRALMVLGPLDFSLTGILSNIANVLADEKISIFAISTFDTDYILVKEDKLINAMSALNKNHYQIKQA